MAHKLIPLILLFLTLVVISFVGYAVYITYTGIAEKTSEKMERKNFVITKDGVKVQVKNVKNEDYVGGTQKYVSLLTILAVFYLREKTIFPGPCTSAIANHLDYAPSLLVKAWNFSTWPAYRSRFWNKDESGPPPSSKP
ncbi:MAG: hypothetical protein M1819_000554 [Sarea resinae]|nr:MAG: hypothetical protein M1819_000554 [Sarea resinae]